MKTWSSFLEAGAIFVIIEILIETFKIEGPYMKPGVFLILGLALIILGIVLFRFEK